LDEDNFRSFIKEKCNYNFDLVTNNDASTMSKSKTHFTLSQINQMQDKTIILTNNLPKPNINTLTSTLNNFTALNSTTSTSFFKNSNSLLKPNLIPKENDMVDVDPASSK